MWTKFWDMHSGGGLKEDPIQFIFIEAPADEAVVVFYNRFKHNPYRVTCSCCGEDYSVSCHETLLQASGFHRSCPMNKDGKYISQNRNKNSVGSLKKTPQGYQTAGEFRKRKDVLIIPKKDIKKEERHGVTPEQGYVWVD